jgi:predicted TIM-barrel fold metal-dependent hydrolase
MSPSEYFARNVNVGASCIPRADLAYKDILGVDKMMWGSDYPHPEGTWPQTQQYYKDVFSGIAEDEGRKILGGNAIDWYGLDRHKLQSVADDIGPTTSIFN